MIKIDEISQQNYIERYNFKGNVGVGLNTLPNSDTLLISENGIYFICCTTHSTLYGNSTSSTIIKGEMLGLSINTYSLPPCFSSVTNNTFTRGRIGRTINNNFNVQFENNLSGEVSIDYRIIQISGFAPPYPLK